MKMTDEEVKEYFEHVGERIRFIREIWEISPEELCEKLEIQRDELEKWESGYGGDMLPEQMYRLARELHVGLDFLYSYEVDECIPKAYLEYLINTGRIF